MQEDVHIAETVLKATMTNPFPGDVRFERECRWVIRLEIAPAVSDYEEYEAFAGKTRGLGHRFELDDELQDITHQTGRNTDRRSDLRRCDEHALPIRSSLQKRKVSGPVMVSQAFSPKRQRCENDGGCENRSWDFVRDAASTPPKTKQDSACLFIPPVAAANSDIPSTRTMKVVTDPDVLQQQQILRNYEEFAGQKSRRDAGFVSPVSEGERKVFESIFLGGEEVWSPASEGSGMEFEAAVGEA